MSVHRRVTKNRTAPLKRKHKAPSVDAGYAEWLKQWPCIICLLDWVILQPAHAGSKLKAQEWREWARREIGTHICGETLVIGKGWRAVPIGRGHRFDHPKSLRALGAGFWKAHSVIESEVRKVLREVYETERQAAQENNTREGTDVN